MRKSLHICPGFAPQSTVDGAPADTKLSGKLRTCVCGSKSSDQPDRGLIEPGATVMRTGPTAPVTRARGVFRKRSSPVIACCNIRHCALTDREHSRKIPLRHIAPTQQLTDGFHFPRREFVSTMLLTTRNTLGAHTRSVAITEGQLPLTGCILCIFLAGSEKQMRRVTAAWVIPTRAVVTYFQRPWVFSAGQGVCNSVRSGYAKCCADHERSIAFRVPWSSPQPAVCGLPVAHKRPKTGSYFGLKHRRGKGAMRSFAHALHCTALQRTFATQKREMVQP